mmetsp:Transcript_23592/g.66656  ORF Transcript_23592/g.66656 Transcript_23592/m.66656 type:complete len:262 (-) Transcript_23592:108-893(-)
MRSDYLEDDADAAAERLAIECAVPLLSDHDGNEEKELCEEDRAAGDAKCENEDEESTEELTEESVAELRLAKIALVVWTLVSALIMLLISADAFMDDFEDTAVETFDSVVETFEELGDAFRRDHHNHHLRHQPQGGNEVGVSNYDSAANLSLHQLTEENWDDFLASKPLAFVNFGASWDPHTQRMAPELKKLAVLASDLPVAIGQVDCAEQHDLCQQHGIMAYPTTRMHIHGKMLDDYGGERTADAMYYTFMHMYIEILYI